MKILQVVHGFPPHNNAGTEIYTYHLSRHLRAQGHAVEIFCRVDDRPRKPFELMTIEREGLRIHEINNRMQNLKSFEWTYRNPTIADAFASLLLAGAPDVVHVQHLTLLSTDLIEICRDHNVPVVMTLQDYWMICQKGQMQQDDGTNCAAPIDTACDTCLRSSATFSSVAQTAAQALDRVVPGFARQGSRLRAIAKSGFQAVAERRKKPSEEVERIERRQNHIRRMLSMVDAFVAPGEYIKQKFVAFGVPTEKILRIDQGIDKSFIAQLNSKSNDRVRFGFVGSLMKSKGVIPLLEAYSQLETGKTELNVWGETAQREDIAAVEAAIERYGQRPDIAIRGGFPIDRKAAVFSEIDVLVVPSTWQENTPFVIQEAFACGIPVIASDIGGIPEMVTDNVSGLLVPAGNVDALAAALGKLRDWDEVRRLAQGAPQIPDIANNAAAYSAIYETVSANAVTATPTQKEVENLHLLESDMAGGSAIWESRPMILEMATNNICDLECIMCAPEGHVSPSSLRKEQVRQFATFVFPAASVMTPSVGSEPFLGNINLMNELCTQYGVQINLITNANFLTAEAFENIKDNLGRIQVSLDSCDPEVYAKIRRGGNFAHVDKNLQAVVPLAAAEGIEVMLSGVLTHDTITRMADFVRYAARVQASAVAFQRLIYIVEGVEDLDPFETMVPEAIEECFERARIAAREGGINLHIDDGMPHVYENQEQRTRQYRSSALTHRFIQEHPGYCYMAAMYMKVDADGRVYPCCRGSDQIVMGNANKQSLREIWNGKEWQKLREEMRTGNLRPWCQGCPFHKLSAEPTEPAAKPRS